MSEYMSPKAEDGSGFLIETPDPKPATVRYFWMISADFIKKLDEPVREYFADGYQIKNVETGQGFMADTIEFPADETVTRMGLLNYAIRRLVESQNDRRAQAGMRIMYDESNVILRAFECGRNEL
jgi:hypothetical protein